VAKARPKLLKYLLEIRTIAYGGNGVSHELPTVLNACSPSFAFNRCNRSIQAQAVCCLGRRSMVADPNLTYLHCHTTH
jgi:hypothetical protein